MNKTWHIDWRDTILTGFIASLLFIPFLGFYKDTRSIVETIEFRWQYVVVGVLVAMIGRIIIRHLFAMRETRAKKPHPTALQVLEATRRRNRIIYFFVAVMLVLPFTPFGDRLLLDRLTVFLIYVMLGWGLNVVIGLAGLLDLGYVAFYAVGAYSFALAAEHLGWSFWMCLPFAGLLAASFGVLLGFPVLRLRGDYLAIVTLGFGEIIRIILLATPELGGSKGISGIPRPSFFGLPFTNSPDEGVTPFHEFFGLEFTSLHRIMFLYFLILFLALLTNWFTMRLRRLPIGRAWEALRENEVACQAMGINPTNTKLTAFAIGAMLAGFAGSFFATRQGFISPESFTFLESAIVVAIVVLGGLGSQLGVVLAAAFLILLPEYFREFESLRMICFGAAMVVIMVWKPKGFVGNRAPTVLLYPHGHQPDEALAHATASAQVKS